jgi:hypothetical protein
MASYAYTANSTTAAASANIATDKARISTSNVAIQFTTSFPNVAVTGTVTTATTSATITGSGTTFNTQLGVGYWVGNTTGATVGIVSAIANNTSLTLVANAAVAISAANLRYNPYGVEYTIANANSSQIPSNTILDSVIVGQGNIVSYLSASGANTIFTITELGMPHASTGTSGIKATPSAGGPTNIPVE